MKKILIAAIFVLFSNSVWSMTMLNIFGTLLLSGEIKRGDASELKKKLEDQVLRVNVRSHGGNVPEAILMAQLLRSSGKILTVEGPCLSACAFMFAFVEMRAIRDGGYVAFHSGELYLLNAVVPAYINYVPKDPALAEKFEESKKRKLEALESQIRLINESNRLSGLNEDWLKKLTWLTAPTIKSIKIDEQLGAINMNADPPKCDWWVPDINGLADIGIVLKNYSTLDRYKVASSLKKPINRIYWEKLSEVDLPEFKACEEK